MEKSVGGTLFPLTKIKELPLSSPSSCLKTIIATHPTLNYPLFSAYVVVPTLVSDSKGLPHCLEHLVFCGSKSYPQRGLLDRLATLCQSQGTNAWTADDHTCYTFTSSSLEGLKKMLPVFLDHIFNPHILEETIRKEVCGLGDDGTALNGVVYCEMQSREWSEGDQLDGAMRRSIFPSSSPLHHYRWETGGATGEISKITPSEIIDYHTRYYRPSNAYLVIIGNSDLDNHSFDFLSNGLFFEGVSGVPGNTGGRDDCISNEAEKQQETKMHFNVIKKVLSPTHNVDVVRFPSEEESIASTCFCWKGPRSDEHLSINALHCLLRSLSEGSASPLQQRFVERSDPLANDIYYDVKASHYTMVSLLFQGVPIEHQSVIREEFLSLMQEFFSISNVSSAIDRIRLSIAEWTLKLEEQYENDPHEQIVSYLIPEMVSPLFGLHSSSLTNYISTIEDDLFLLKEKDIGFWKDLYEEFLVSPTSEIWSSPSKRMNQEIKEEENKHLLAFNGAGGCVDGLDGKHNSSLNDLFKGHPLLDEVVVNPPILRQKIKETQYTSKDGLKVNGVQIIGDTDGERCRFMFAFPILSGISKDLWKYLLIFQESLFQLDLSLPEDSKIFQLLPNLKSSSEVGSTKMVSYQDLQEQMSLKFTKNEASVGLGNQLFYTGYLGTHLMISMVAKFDPTRSDDDLIELVYYSLLDIISCSVWEEGRIGEIVDNLLSVAKENWRDASAVMCGLEGHLLGDSSPLYGVENALNLSEQSILLESIAHGDGDGDDRVDEIILDNLKLISKTLVGIKPLLQFGRQRAASLEEEEEEVQQAKISKINEESSCFALGYQLPIFKNGFKGTNDGLSLNIVPMSDITSSYLSMMISSNVFSMDESFIRNKDSMGLILFCQLLSFTEGPLYSLLRGKGLCYGASLSLSLWAGSLSLCISESVDPISAILESRDLFANIIAEANIIIGGAGEGAVGMEILNEELLKIAKAVDVYNFVTARSSDNALMNTIFRNRLRGFPAFSSEDEKTLQNEMISVSLKDLSRSILRFIPPIMDALNFVDGSNGNLCSILATPSHKLEDIKESCLLSKIPIKISDYKSPISHP